MFSRRFKARHILLGLPFFHSSLKALKKRINRILVAKNMHAKEKMFPAVCAYFGAACEVPFEPYAKQALYCQAAYKNMAESLRKSSDKSERRHALTTSMQSTSANIGA